jgi:NTP pyrophosphatase (non-canonical NTP hydrolase)
MSLTLDEYQDRTQHTAKYPGSGAVEGLYYTALGLGEAGEVQGKIKKIMRDDGGILTDEKRQAIAGELGDVLWYVAAMAKELGASLGDIAQANLDKLASRRERGVIGGSGDNR